MSTVNRRRFMGSALTFSTVTGFASSSLVLADQLDRLQQEKHLVLYRETSAQSRAFASTLAANGIETLALEADVVRQWRDGLEAELCEKQKLLVGMGNWADFTLLKGLAAEVRRFPLMTMQHPLKNQDESWAQQHAEELLSLTRLSSGTELEQAISALQQRSALEASSPSLFTWVIG